MTKQNQALRPCRCNLRNVSLVSSDHPTKTSEQSVPENGLGVSGLCILSFRVEVKVKDTKVVPCK